MGKAVAVTYRRKPDSGRSTYKQRERIIQRAIARDLNSYPTKIDFYCDWSSGAFLTVGQNKARMAMASKNGWVDIFIAEPRNGFYGLFIELKKEGERVFLKDGSISKTAQIQKENDFLERMRAKGYKAEFGVGYYKAKRIYEEYLGIKRTLFSDDLPF
jgi:hypothetical protein